MSDTATEPHHDETLYKFSIYPFSTDYVFQEGLQSIVSAAHGKSSEELENIIGQAKAFYFTRTTGQTVTWENYLEWRKSHPSPFPDTPAVLPDTDLMVAPTAVSTGVEARGVSAPLSFQQITELIRTGQTHLIPNNRAIPDALHSDTPSESTNPTRKKPWEEEVESTITGDPMSLGVQPE